MIITLLDEQPMSWNVFYSGKHWSKRSAEKNRVRQLVRAAIDPNIPPFRVPVDITLTSYRKSKRRFDPDNLCDKFYIDGLVPFVIEDDDYTHVNSVKTAVRIDRDNPRVEIEVNPA